MNAQEKQLIANASKVTVINDSQMQYPVATSDLVEWEAKNGPLNDDSHEAFAAVVPVLEGAERAAGLTGTRGMIELCEALIEAGADNRHW